MKLFDLDDKFQEFMQKVYPTVREHDDQYKESKRVFVAGVTCLYYHLTLGLTELPDSEAEQELESIHQQIDEFFVRNLNDDMT